MSITTHSARITGPVSYLAEGGHLHHIPVGPCLIEAVAGAAAEGRAIDIIWGAHGQSSAALTLDELLSAQSHGHLVLLD
jgi:hypothetical protein